MTKHLLLIPLLALLLVSCATPQPKESIDNFNAMKPVCDAQNRQTFVNETTGEAYCSYSDPVQYCIDKYVNSIDEKYNNPDTVSNLQDTNFSEAVRTCNEVFGNKHTHD